MPRIRQGGRKELHVFVLLLRHGNHGDELTRLAHSLNLLGFFIGAAVAFRSIRQTSVLLCVLVSLSPTRAQQSNIFVCVCVTTPYSCAHI